MQTSPITTINFEHHGGPLSVHTNASSCRCHPDIVIGFTDGAGHRHTLRLSAAEWRARDPYFDID